MENTGLSVGLSLGVLLIAAILLATVVITILCVQISREKADAYEISRDAYEIMDLPHRKHCAAKIMMGLGGFSR